MIHPNQHEAARQITVALMNAAKEGKKTHHVVVYAPTQSGKTGIELAVIKELMHRDANCTPRNPFGFGETFCVLFEPPDNDLRRQFNNDLIEEFDSSHCKYVVETDQPNDYCFSSMTASRLARRVKLKIGVSGANLIVMLDEAHIGTGEKQQLDKSLKDVSEIVSKVSSIKNAMGEGRQVEHLFLVWISATPWPYVEYFAQNNIDYTPVQLAVGVNYVGSDSIWPDVYPCQTVQSLASEIVKETYSPGIALVRITNPKEQKAFVNALNAQAPNKFEIIHLDSRKENSQARARVESMLENCKRDSAAIEGEKSVIIIAKQMLGQGVRVGNTANHELRVVCEYSTRSHILLLQGLFGRMTGYDKRIESIKFLLGVPPKESAEEIVSGTRECILQQLENPFVAHADMYGIRLGASKTAKSYAATYPLVLDSELAQKFGSTVNEMIASAEAGDQAKLQDAWVQTLYLKNVPPEIVEDCKKHFQSRKFKFKKLAERYDREQTLSAPRVHGVEGDQARAAKDLTLAVPVLPVLEEVLVSPRKHGKGISDQHAVAQQAISASFEEVYVVTWWLSDEIVRKFESLKQRSPGLQNEKRAGSHISLVS